MMPGISYSDRLAVSGAVPYLLKLSEKVLSVCLAAWVKQTSQMRQITMLTMSQPMLCRLN